MNPITTAPAEPAPGWAANPARPRWQDVRRGILYTWVPEDVVRLLIAKTDPMLAMAAVGRLLFFGRDDADWIPYDRDAHDQNDGCKVRDRPWPYCWGDEVWGLFVWDTQPVAIHWAKDNGCQVFVGSPGRGGHDTIQQMWEHVLDWARGTTPRAAHVFPTNEHGAVSAEFWTSGGYK